MKEQEIYYYSDELNDEFSGSHITPRVIDEKYKYLHKNIFWNLAHFLVQNVLSVPIKVLYAKLKFRIKYIGKEKLKKYKKHLHFQVKCVNIDKDAVVYQVIFLDSSMVEHSAVNRVVVGSSPTRGVFS